MNISLFCAHDNGGAGKAALRLNAGLNLIGEDSTLFVRYKTSGKPKVVQLQTPEINNSVFDRCVRKHFFANTHEGNTTSSAMYPSVGFDYLESIRATDIVNLHWIPTLVSVEAIVKIRQMGIPVVWTLHDQNPMTGACHYTHGCDKYKENCSGCPQLKTNPCDITRVLLETKIKYLPKDIAVVAPSQWLADCAKESAVFKEHRIEIIPNSLETDVFQPVDKGEARRRLSLPPDDKIILFGAQDLKEKRKGFPELVEALGYLRSIPDGHDNFGKLHMLVFGSPSPLLDTIDIPYTVLGMIDTDEALALAYSAADVTALPSLEDNLPNIMLESMACGTPVVAFQTGGMAAVIVDGKNGYLAPLKDTRKFAERIADALRSGSLRASCRGFAEQNYRLEIQAHNYRDLFFELNRKLKKPTVATDVPVIFPEVAGAMGDYICQASVETQIELVQAYVEREKFAKQLEKYVKTLEGIRRSRSWKIARFLSSLYKKIHRIFRLIWPFPHIRSLLKKKRQGD
ncbi:MAG: glycosyltransferase [Bacillota bacterium]